MNKRGDECGWSGTLTGIYNVDDETCPKKMKTQSRQKTATVRFLRKSFAQSHEKMEEKGVRSSVLLPQRQLEQDTISFRGQDPVTFYY